MTEFWTENQGQLPPYAKFGTVPGRNYAHNYHDRHHTSQYLQAYYDEQQQHGREPTYWTAPASRAAGTLREYPNWSESEPTVPASVHFPFVLERHPQQHQHLGEYEPQEARDRDWTAASYERGFLREGWQRRWEPCGAPRSGRDLPKRSDSSYRELEAWAARYSHSLPRRRRIEAELRGATQGLLDRDGRAGSVAAMHQVNQPASTRDSGLWDRAIRQHSHYPPQVATPDTRHLLDMKEKAGYQRRMFSQPPGYIAPPPYNTPQKRSPVMHNFDSSWQQEIKRQSEWPQPALRRQEASADLEKKREDLQKAQAAQKTSLLLEGLKYQRLDEETLQDSGNVQPTLLQTPPATAIQTPSSKVIEGRKFRLNKKTGGLTIFCLVSRIANVTDTPSLPVCTNTQTTELERLSSNGQTPQTTKLADEVDNRVYSLVDKPGVSDPSTNARQVEAEQAEIPTCTERLEGMAPDKDETDVVPLETHKAESSAERQAAPSVPPLSVKYPLWREPSFTSRPETESLKEDCDEVAAEDADHAEVNTHPSDVEVRRLDISREAEPEDSKGLLVIDTSCVVVKMEVIPSPKKEQVHYLGSTDDSKQTHESKTLHQDATSVMKWPESHQDSEPLEEKAQKVESEFSFPSPLSETLEERAERILGIPLEESRIGAVPAIDLSAEDHEDEAESLQGENPPRNATEEEQSENLFCDDDDGKELATGEGDGAVALETLSAPNHVQEALQSSPEEVTSELNGEENQAIEDENSKYLSQSSHFLDSISQDSEDPDSAFPHSSPPSSTTEEITDPESGALDSAPQCEAFSPSQHIPPPLPLGSIEPLLPPLDITRNPVEATSTISSEVRDEGLQTSEKAMSNVFENLSVNAAEEKGSQQQNTACSQMRDDVCEKESILTEETAICEAQFTTELSMNISQKVPENLADILQCSPECVCANLMAEPQTDIDEDLSSEGAMNGQREDVQQFDGGQAEEDVSVKQNEEHSHQDKNREHTGSVEEIIGKVDAAECQSQVQSDSFNASNALTEPDESLNSPSDSDQKAIQLSCQLDTSHTLDTRIVSHVAESLDSALAHQPDGISPPLLDSSEESLLNSCCSSSVSASLDSAPHPHPPEESSGCDFPNQEEPQYPQSLWDAVNRIRKHTAPDSENEEEEVSELWDPESAGEDMNTVDTNSEDMPYCGEAKKQAPTFHNTADVTDEADLQELFEVGRVDVGESMPGPCELTRQTTEDDTLSCSSTISQDSGDTVIIADEDEPIDEAPLLSTESMVPESHTADGVKCGPEDVKDETPSEDEGDKSDIDLSNAFLEIQTINEI